MNKMIVITMAIMGLLLVGCSTSEADSLPAAPATQAPTAAPPSVVGLATSVGEIVGAWEYKHNRLVFKADGTFSWATSFDTGAEGAFQFEDARLSIKNTTPWDTQTSCDYKKFATYEVQLLTNANLKFVAIEDECPDRIAFLVDEQDKEWAPVPAPGPVTSVEGIAGVWQRRGGHYVQFNADGTFTCAPSRLKVEEGTGCKGKIWFEGAQLSVEVDACPADSIGVYQVQRLESGTLEFETVQEDPCTWRVEFFVGSGSLKTEFESTP